MGPPLDQSVVRHVARLARLRINDAEAALFASQLSMVLKYVEQLNEADTNGVLPTAHTLPVSNVFREDEVRPSLSSDQALHNAPDRHDGFFRVPRVLDQESA